jgi:hypothetical protein
LKFLIQQFEEESSGDQDYYIDQPTLDMLKEENAPRNLVDLLQRALGTRDGMEIRWSRR